MSQRFPPARLPLPAGLGLLAVALATFGALAADLLRHGPLTRADAGISAWFHGHLLPAATQALTAISLLHSTAGICLMALIAACILAWQGQRQWLPLLVASVPGGLVLNALVKQAFQRSRPVFLDPLLTLPTYSFPSGHTAGATVWWGFFMVYVFTQHPRLHWRIAAGLLGIAMVCLTALSRVYLGVHYPSDVLAAVAEGGAWLALCFTVPGLARELRPDASRTPRHG